MRNRYRPKERCKVPLTYSGQVELIVISTHVGRGRLDEALNKLDEGRKEISASEFCLRLEKDIRGKVESSVVAAHGSNVTGEALAYACLGKVPSMKRKKTRKSTSSFAMCILPDGRCKICFPSGDNNVLSSQDYSQRAQ